MIKNIFWTKTNMSYSLYMVINNFIMKGKPTDRKNAPVIKE